MYWYIHVDDLLIYLLYLLGDVHREDFADIISSQQEINRLRSDVRRLTTEVQHWRQMATDQQVRQYTALLAELYLCTGLFDPNIQILRISIVSGLKISVLFSN